MDAIEAWKRELDTPTEAFFAALAARLRMPDGARDATREAIKSLVPRIAWESYLPHVPHGLLGLDAAFRLRPLLTEASFHRVLATQLHAFAHEGRRRTPWDISVGSGHWPHVEMAIQRHLPPLAYGEMQGIQEPSEADFRRVGDCIVHDMANMGHKAVMANGMRELFVALDRPKATGRRLAGIVGWLAASEPEDRFWAKRAAARIGDDFSVPGTGEAFPDGDAAVREICDSGLVELLNAFTARLKNGAAQSALLDALVRAACEKQLDARRDLEGKTSWALSYLVMLASAHGTDGKAWCQAAALVNLFPTDEPEGRVQAIAPTGRVEEAALVDAILDSEPARAMGLAVALDTDASLRGLAEAASQNDPAFNQSHHLLAASAAVNLVQRVSMATRGKLLAAVAKSLANSQGSSDLGRQAGKVLQPSP